MFLVLLRCCFFDSLACANCSINAVQIRGFVRNFKFSCVFVWLLFHVLRRFDMSGFVLRVLYWCLEVIVVSGALESSALRGWCFQSSILLFIFAMSIGCCMRWMVDECTLCWLLEQMIRLVFCNFFLSWSGRFFDSPRFFWASSDCNSNHRIEPIGACCARASPSLPTTDGKYSCWRSFIYTNTVLIDMPWLLAESFSRSFWFA